MLLISNFYIDFKTLLDLMNTTQLKNFPRIFLKQEAPNSLLIIIKWVWWVIFYAIAFKIYY